MGFTVAISLHPNACIIGNGGIILCHSLERGQNVASHYLERGHHVASHNLERGRHVAPQNLERKNHIVSRDLEKRHHIVHKFCDKYFGIRTWLHVCLSSRLQRGYNGVERAEFQRRE